MMSLMILTQAAQCFGSCSRVLGLIFSRPFGRGGHQGEAEVIAGVLQLAQAPLLALLLAAEGDGDVDEVHARLAQQAHRHAADDALVVRVRREEQRLGRVGGNRRPRGGLEGAEREGAAFLEQARVVR